MKFYATDWKNDILCELFEVSEKEFVKKHIAYAKRALYNNSPYETIYGHFENGDIVWIDIACFADVIRISLNRNDTKLCVCTKEYPTVEIEDDWDIEDDWEYEATQYYWDTRM